MNSMTSNQVWDIIKFPNDVKAIECKWVFKRKRDSQGNIERYKERLVVKGFSQREGIDCTKTYSPISKKDYFRVIMASTTHFEF